MHQLRTAIVLKQVSSHKVALFDKYEGRLDAIAMQPVHLGAVVHYRVEQVRSNALFVRDLELIDLPFIVGTSDILFWHHILELCFYFVPIASPSLDLFELLSFLYTMDTWYCWSAQTKKLYLCKVLITIGWYSETAGISPAIMQYIQAVPLDQIHKVKLDEKSEKRVDEWLRVCVADHPAIEQFKTMHFLRGD